MLLSNRLSRNPKSFLPSTNEVARRYCFKSCLSVCVGLAVLLFTGEVPMWPLGIYLNLVTWGHPPRPSPPPPPIPFPSSNSSIENVAPAQCKITLTIIDDDVILVAVAVHSEVDEIEFDPESLGSSYRPPALQVPVVTTRKVNKNYNCVSIGGFMPPPPSCGPRFVRFHRNFSLNRSPLRVVALPPSPACRTSWIRLWSVLIIISLNIFIRR